MGKYRKNQLVLIDNELYIILKVLKNNKYKTQHLINKKICVVEEFYISSY